MLTGLAATRRNLGRDQAGAVTTFETVYSEHFGFVWRSLRRLGVAEASLDDAVQDVFIVVHRRLSSFAGASSIKTWLFAIVLRVAHDHRRRATRKGHLEPLPATLADPAGADPFDAAARAETARLLDRFLDQLGDEKRAAFVLVELEQMTVPEAAVALGVNVNTAGSRLRAARMAFNAAVARWRAGAARSL